MQNVEQFKIPIIEGINDYPLEPNYNNNNRGPNGSYFTARFNSLVDVLSNYTTSEQSNSIVGVESAGQLKYYGTNNLGIAGFYSFDSAALQPGDNISDLINDSGYLTAITVPVTSVASKTGAVILAKSDVGLGNVDNTSDLNKPISTATQNALDLKADLVGGKIPNTQLPSLAITEYLGSVSDQSAMLALVGQRGDWCTRTDTGSTFILVADGGDILADWQEISTPLDSVSSVNGFTGSVVLNAFDVGAETSSQLDTRDTANRSRANHTGTQEISTITGLQTALDTKIEAVPFGGFIEKIEDKTYPLFKPDHSYLIKSLRVKSDSGTCTWSIQIDDVDVTGLSAIAVSSVEQVVTATAANLISAGQRVTIVSTNNDGAIDVEFTIMLEVG